MIFHLRDWSMILTGFSSTSLLFSFFKLAALEAIEDHCEPETLQMQSSFHRIRVFLPSVAPHTATSLCLKPRVQKLYIFHNEYLSALYSQSQWQQKLSPSVFFIIFYCRFLFLFTRTEKRLPFCVKDSPWPLRATDIAGGWWDALGHV